jgi:hypothetical protein
VVTNSFGCNIKPIHLHRPPSGRWSLLKVKGVKGRIRGPGRDCRKHSFKAEDSRNVVSSSYAARSDGVEDLCNSNTLVHDRSRMGPGLPSTVANGITDILPKSEDGTEWPSSQSLFRTFECRPSPLQPENAASPYLPPVAVRVVVLLSLSWCRKGKKKLGSREERVDCRQR